MDQSYNKEHFKHGTVKISNDIIIHIAAVAAAEVEGVSSLVGYFPEDTVDPSKRSVHKGVKIFINDNVVTVDISLNMYLNYKVLEVSRQVQENVKNKIEVMTGLQVDQVNVFVEGLS